MFDSSSAVFRAVIVREAVLVPLMPTTALHPLAWDLRRHGGPLEDHVWTFLLLLINYLPEASLGVLRCTEPPPAPVFQFSAHTTSPLACFPCRLGQGSSFKFLFCNQERSATSNLEKCEVGLYWERFLPNFFWFFWKPQWEPVVSDWYDTQPCY